MASDYSQIVKLYTDAEKQLLAAVEKAPTSGTSKAYMQRLLKRVQKVLKELRDNSSRLNSEVVKQAYYDGIMDVQRAISKGASLSVELHAFDSAADALAEETDAYYRKAIAATGRRINDEICETLSAATEKKFSEWQTIQEMRRDLLKSLQDSTSPAVIGVETRNGRVIPLKSYASMAARTSVVEAQNRAKVMYCLQSDIDLLKCSKHTPTCEICSQYQGRVYALTKEAASGKYKGPNGEPLRFPYIYDTVFVDGYETIHPNCRHRMSPFVAEAYTPEEVAEYSRQSMQPFADVRSDAERKAYQASQVKNNRRRADMKQYLRYKERLGEDKVLKTFAAFRSIKSKNGDAWDRLQSEYRKHAENVTGDSFKEKYLKSAVDSVIINTGGYAGAKKTPGWEDRHAEQMYEEIRHRTTDVKRIAESTPFSEKAVSEIKDHLFFKEHRFKDGTVHRFEEDFEQVQAWDRLTQGKGTPVDIVLLKHEYVELTQMRIHGYVYETAHAIANRKWNWWDAFLKEAGE